MGPRPPCGLTAGRRLGRLHQLFRRPSLIASPQTRRWRRPPRASAAHQHRLSTQAVAELTFVGAQLRALRLVPSMDRILVSFEASEKFRTGDVYRAL
jgi:hypothetical protein